MHVIPKNEDFEVDANHALMELFRKRVKVGSEWHLVFATETQLELIKKGGTTDTSMAI